MNNIKIVAVGIGAFVGLIVLWGSWTIVNPQQEGIIVRLGSIKRNVDSGFNFKMPLVESIVKMDISTNAIKGNELAYTKDGQTLDFEATVTYSINRSFATEIYREYKKDYEARVIVPSIKESIKSVASLYTAQGVLDNRAKLSPEMRAMIIEQIGAKGFEVQNVAITNIDFDDAYENAIKNKQVQEQQALAQINVTKQEDEKKKQEILKAEALAEKTRLESQALASQQGEKVINKIYAEAALEAAKKWNGVLPTQMIPGQTLPFIQLGK